MAHRRTIATVFGTRPEAIKFAPLIWELRSRRETFDALVVVTAQHRGMLDQVLDVFKITPDEDLDLMRDGQSLSSLTSLLAASLDEFFRRRHVDMVLVQGDTTTTFMAALEAYYHRIPVGHVEAGLRTHDKWNPFPEEMNRRLVSSLADLHFAPTRKAADNLLGSEIPSGRVFVTGNTGIDALRWVSEQYAFGSRPSGGGRNVLVTAHRRESFGEPLERICRAIAQLVERYHDLHVTLPVHPNPNVRAAVEKTLGGVARIDLQPPMPYLEFARAMHDADLILTDSGGVQEEAPYFGIPVLVMRETSERMEGVEAGCLKLVGTQTESIVREAAAILEAPAKWEGGRGAANPFGDGWASRRIVDAIAGFFEDPGHDTTRG
jgi:UDP-N-acetylglucosamine 2-epimerase (non-hydrolysing)